MAEKIIYQIPIVGRYLQKRRDRTIVKVERGDEYPMEVNLYCRNGSKIMVISNKNLLDGVGILPQRRGSQIVRKTFGGHSLKQITTGLLREKHSQSVFLPKGLGDLL